MLFYRLYIGLRIAAEQLVFLADHDYPHMAVHVQRPGNDAFAVQSVVYYAGADSESIQPYNQIEKRRTVSHLYVFREVEHAEEFL